MMHIAPWLASAVLHSSQLSSHLLPLTAKPIASLTHDLPWRGRRGGWTKVKDPEETLAEIAQHQKIHIVGAYSARAGLSKWETSVWHISPDFSLEMKTVLKFRKFLKFRKISVEEGIQKRNMRTRLKIMKTEVVIMGARELHGHIKGRKLWDSG